VIPENRGRNIGYKIGFMHDGAEFRFSVRRTPDLIGSVGLKEL